MLLDALFLCNDPATTEMYTYWHTLSLHDALPICLTQNHWEAPFLAHQKAAVRAVLHCVSALRVHRFRLAALPAPSRPRWSRVREPERKSTWQISAHSPRPPRATPARSSR